MWYWEGCTYRATNHQQSGLYMQAFPVNKCAAISTMEERAPLLLSSSGTIRKGPTSEHTGAPSEGSFLYYWSRKDRPLSKAVSGPQIFLDPLLALKHKSRPLQRLHLHHYHHLHYRHQSPFVFYVILCRDLAHPVFYFILSLTLESSEKFPPCARLKATQQVRELGLLTTMHPLFCTGCFTHVSSPHAFWFSRILHSFGDADGGVRHTAAMILGRKAVIWEIESGSLTQDQGYHLSTQHSTLKTNHWKSSHSGPTQLSPGARTPALFGWWLWAWRKVLELIQKDKVKT